MKIILKNTEREFNEYFSRITDFKFFVHPLYIADDPLLSEFFPSDSDFYLGSSDDNSVFTLAVLPWAENEKIEDGFPSRWFCNAILIDPIAADEVTIFKILFLAHQEEKRSVAITTTRLNEIQNSFNFPTFKTVGEYSDGLPKTWSDYEVEFNVGFVLSEGACLYREIFKEYQRDNFKEILEVLYGPRYDGLLFCYHVVARHTIPFLGWDADWPLLGRGKNQPVKRKKMEGVIPGEYDENCKLLSLYQRFSHSVGYGTPPYFGKPTVYLRVGGITEEDAIKNWRICANLLRPMAKIVARSKQC